MEGAPRAKVESPFDKSFEELEQIDVGGGSIEVVDISPKELADETPVTLSPAWSCTIPVYKAALEELANEGRRALSLNHAREGGEITLDEAQQELVKEYPKEEVRKALSLLKMLETKGVDKTDVIGHSEGAANAMIAALLHPERFRNLVLFGPAGLIGKDTPLRLLKGFASQGNPKPTLDEIPVSDAEKEAARSQGQEAIEYPAISPTEVSRGNAKIVMKETPRYVAANVLRSVAEGWGLSKLQMEGLLRTLHEKGIGISVMSGVDDPVFPTGRMAETISKSKNPGEDITNILDGFLAVRGGHGELGDHPETHVAGALALLKAMEAKRDRKAKSDTSA